MTRRFLSDSHIVASAIACLLTVAVIVLGVVGVVPPAVGAADLFGAPRSPQQNALVAGHRGGAQTAPENTLPAVRASIASGVDFLEVDVALTADRVPVLMHDPTVDRTTNGSGALAELSYEQVRALDAGSWFSADFAGTRVPSFTEFVAVLALHPARALVELKGEWDYPAIVALVGQLSARHLTDSVAFASFDAAILAMISSASPRSCRVAAVRELPADIAATVVTMGVSAVVVKAGLLASTPQRVRELHAVGVRIFVYTLNSPAGWREAVDLGADGIVTDDPAGLAAWQVAR